jgi:hypothetical protein
VAITIRLAIPRIDAIRSTVIQTIRKAKAKVRLAMLTALLLSYCVSYLIHLLIMSPRHLLRQTIGVLTPVDSAISLTI